MTLVDETPRAQCWTMKLQEKGIFEAMSNGAVVGSLLLRNVGGRTGMTVNHNQNHPIPQPLYSSPLARIEYYARVSAEKEVTASVATALANYQIFLVLSSCAVLHRLDDDTRSRLPEFDISTEEIYRIVKICMGNDSSNEYCAKILRGCRFVHELMDNLYLGGWGLRAFELLLICSWNTKYWRKSCSTDEDSGNKTPAFYSTMSDAYSTSLALLQKNLCAKELTAGVAAPATDWTSIFAPKIVHDILGENLG